MLMRTAVLALVAAAGLAHAQIAPPPAQPPAQPTTPATTTPAQAAPGLTLIKQDPTSGKVLRVEAPEEAAMELVGLTPEEKAAVDRVLQARYAMLDAALSANIGTLLKTQGLRKDDNRTEQMQALVELRKQVLPKIEAYNKENGTLTANLQTVLPAEKFAAVTKLASDYRQATFTESMATFRTSAEKDEQRRQAQVRGMETMMAFGFEVVRSVDRKQAAKSSDPMALAGLVTEVKATPEQELKLHGLVGEYLAIGQPTTMQRREFFKKFFIELDDRQKLVLMSHLYGVTPPEAAPVPVPAPVAEPSASVEPAALTDEQIASLGRNEALKEWATRKAYLQKNPGLAEATRTRLAAEAEKCKERMQKAPK